VYRCTCRVPPFSVCAVFFVLPFRRISNLRRFNSSNSSIPTAATNHLPNWSGLKKNARGQNGANNPDDPVRARILSGTSDSRIPWDVGVSYRLRAVM